MSAEHVRLVRAQGPAASARFFVAPKRVTFGLGRPYALHEGPVFEVEYIDGRAVLPADVNPEGELSAAEEERLLAERPWEITEARSTYWTTREAAEAEVRAALDRVDPRLSAEGHGDAMAAAQTRRDETSVWWARGDETPLWRVTATVREFRQVVESGGGVTVCLGRAAPNGDGHVASLTIAADDGTYGCTTGIYADRITRRGGDGMRSSGERAAEGGLLARAIARAAALGEDVAAAVAAAEARGAVCAYPVGE